MGRGSRGSGHQPARRPTDLTGIISVAERNDFVALVNAITDSMQKDMSNPFDSPPVRPDFDLGGHGQGQWLSLPLLRHRHENKENISTVNGFHGSILDDRSTAYHSKARQTVQKEVAENSQPLGELKKEILGSFRKWQSNVLQRFTEINVNDAAAAPSSPRGRARSVRGTYRAGRGGRGGRGGSVALTLATGPHCVPTRHIDPDLVTRHPPLPNPLWSLHIDRRKLLLHIALLVLLSLQDYKANSRLLLVKLTSSLNLSFRTYQLDEARVAQGLVRAALDALREEDAVKSDETRAPRKFKMAFGNGPGSSGPVNLAAALKDVGIGTCKGGLGLPTIAAAGLLGTMAENGILMGSLFGINPARPVNKMLETFAREIQDFAFVRLCDGINYDYIDARESAVGHRRLRVLIAVSGFMTGPDDVVRPWRSLNSQPEIYAIRWEHAALTNLGSALETVIKSTAWESAKREIKSKSIFKSLMTSAWPEPLLRISKIVDNAWSVGMVRAEKAGAMLADALIRHKFQGERPVSLIGYSLGARAIYACLMVLAERRQFGFVDSVVMMGAPFPAESRVWLTLRSVVSGRLVNVYSEHDYVLGFLYRTCNLQFGIAGLQEIQGAGGVENHCIHALPKGHLSYSSLTGHILRDIGWEDFDMHGFRREFPPQDMRKTFSRYPTSLPRRGRHRG
ncbi:DUF726 domain-containing protein [Metarhizium album ARSEF 1941]|uniref:DUF726 domain-containing protein n=1 Tax=Metarhizium album (strain ARSEF 1941) TaxID=1081103 RepID=A0A0B2X8W6_METAS|nr:DUF726 domain-containing protein [Metarhizium album ARSEF 1941]KHO02010.1 DUF726 domain-containing protein [Metarhizium album ARSEF 1941]